MNTIINILKNVFEWVMKNPKKSLIITITLLVSLSLIRNCAKKDVIAKAEPIPVRVHEIKEQDLEKTLEYTGSIKGEDEVLIYPKVSGKVIEKVHEDGSQVTKGEPILFVDRDEVGLKFEKAPVESPLTGIVGRVYVDIGSNVSTTTPVALVSTVDRVQINLEIPEKYMPAVTIGQDAQIIVDAYPGVVFKGKVTKVSPVAEIETRSAPIEIMINNQDHRLMSGMFAKVRLVISEDKNALVILREAIIGKSPDTHVYVVEDGKAFLRKVELGRRQGTYYAVTNGLKPGDLVVVMGQQRLRDGVPVIFEKD